MFRLVSSLDKGQLKDARIEFAALKLFHSQLSSSAVV